MTVNEKDPYTTLNDLFKLPNKTMTVLEMPSHTDELILDFLFHYGNQLIKENKLYENNRRNQNSDKRIIFRTRR
jgi:hypothetical protein